ncbi:MAG: hypothetical protein PHU40_05350 [Sulfurimonas sp.]|nr:hypothetical protein [Sulfurimonas sp.]
MFHFFIKLALFIVLAVSLHGHSGVSQKHLLFISADKNIEIAFDLPIMKTSVQRNTVELKKVDSHQKMKGKLSLKDEKTLLFSPEKELMNGTYELQVDPIKLQKCVQQHSGWFDKFFSRDKCSITTRPIKHRFKTQANQAKIVGLDVNQTAINLKENTQTMLQVLALYDDNTSKDISQDAEWVIGDSTIIAVDQAKISALQEGTTTLQILYDGIKSNELHVRVYKEVNGYILPLEPDETLNNATLLGIDSNNNGVRDDVERWIFLEMKIYNGYEKIEQVIAMQEAKAFQMSLIDSTNQDDLVHKAMQASTECWVWYSYSKNLPFQDEMLKFSREIKDKCFNTKERLKTYWEYDNTLRGRIFTATPTLQTKSQCETDIDSL